MSDFFYICDLRLGIFVTSLIVKREILKSIQLKNTHRTSTVISGSCHYRPFLTIQIQMRSPGVTNGFLPITRDRSEIKTWGWSHCVSLVKTHRFMYNLTYFSHNVILTWGQNFYFDLSRSSHTCFDAHWRGKYDGVKIIVLSFPTRKLSSKNCSAPKCHFWPFVTSDV